MLNKDGSYFIKFRLPGQPDPLNKMLRMHHLKRYRLNKKWYEAVYLAVCRNLPKVPLDKAHLLFCLYNTRRLDFDGSVGSLKPIVDGLVRAKIIRNDSFIVTGQWFVDQKLCKKGLELIEIVVTERL